MNIEEKVKNFKRKNEIGFTISEEKELLKEFPGIDMRKYNNALNRITCIEIDGEIILYTHDIINALYCGIERRNLRNYEWD
jgi:hypothetical protein